MKLRLQALALLLCFVAVVELQSPSGDDDNDDRPDLGPRGNRPVLPGVASQKSGQCLQAQDLPPCTDQDWGKRCPSGCRVQGLINKADREYEDRIDKLRKLLNDNQNIYKTASQITKETYDAIKNNLIADSGGDNRYAELVNELRKKIVILRQYINNQLNKIRQLHGALLDQVSQIKRLEVDIDIRIRACKGSCSKGFVYNVDRQSYETLQKQLEQIGSYNLRTSDDADNVRVLKMRRLKDEPASVYKAAQTAGEEPATAFSDIQVNWFIIERKSVSGSSSTDLSAKETLDSSTVISAPLVKETTGTGTGEKYTTSTTTRVVKCTKTVTKKIVMTKDGPVETVEVTGGDDSPECARIHQLGLGEVDGVSSSSSVKVTGSSSLSSFGDTYPDLSQFMSRQPIVTKETVSGGGGSITKQTWTSETVGGGGGSDSFGSSTSKFSTYPGDADGTRSTSTRYSSSTQTGGNTGSGTFTSTKYTSSSTGGSDGMTMGEFDDSAFFSSHIPSESAGSLSHSKTTTYSSSSSSTKDGPYSDRQSKSKFPLTDDDDFIQQDQSGEDFPNPQARSFRTEVEKKESSVLQDCEDIHHKHTSGSKSGLFQIKPSGSQKVITVYCDQETGLGGWVVIQQRTDGSLNFNRTWDEYKKGFGSIDSQGNGNLWLGNENIHLLTSKESVLRIELEDWSGNKAYAEYYVTVGSESGGYVLQVSHYEGDAGDALIKGTPEDSQNTHHNGMKFSTYDRDNDLWEENCAVAYGGGWWHNNCQAANLNGIYYQGQYDPRDNVPYETENGVVWTLFRSGDYSLKVVRMKIRPVETQ
ncbi:fibrinogen alpha chain [Protopterus annectens]|uniref:fibrinogen alpha chain n=1 Tax=Protopterus annectens TaxID=7888 RepID=UPI001CF9379D|nr:fibrinogen alpha chain [Protopterus annectens]